LFNKEPSENQICVHCFQDSNSNAVSKPYNCFTYIHRAGNKNSSRMNSRSNKK